MKESKKGILSKKDITMVGFRSVLNQAGFNYERMQAIGFTSAMVPALKKIYKNDKKGLIQATEDNLEFINTHNVLVPFLMGLMLSLQENKEDPKVVKGIKVSLFGPMAGIGDAIFWFTLLPITAGICASFASEGSILGPVLFFLVFLAAFLLRIPLAHIGYNTGTKAIALIKNNVERVSRAASILGITVLGGLIASYVSINVLTTIEAGEGNIISIQESFFDKIFPNLLPFCFTFLMLYLIRKKVNPVALITGTLILSILLSYLGVL
ncbi:MAG: PTS galactosamine transporter subunit IID [Bacilli bacterium]|nr:PTS galactosamine transporter subunit IID [Bacilli bacterium]MDD4298604.1 PTS galactosamine transporter subunit IID [Bacilli bacterium]